MTDIPTSSIVKSAYRAVLVLEHLASAEKRQSLDSLHRSLGIPKSSLHGLLRTLRSREWVEVDESGTLFRLGVRALLVGTAYIDSDEVVALTRDTMDRLVVETGETIHLGRLDGPEIVYLATRQSTHQLRLFSRVGRRLPAHATALGKILLSFLSKEELEDLMSPHLQGLTANTITDLAVLHEELDETRRRGYAIDQEESSIGIKCIGFAVPFGGPPRDAISISVPLARLDDERSAELTSTLRFAVDELRSRVALASS
jgi:IclR family acetate operon transcriptional repressor